MGIGDTLAEARRQAGLTLTQVSQQTRIRESIIRSIEQGDFSSCGGDFYARGHIRSVANVVGTDPGPLIREYDEEHGTPGSMRAAQIFAPATPIRIREPRSLHLGLVLAVVLLAAAGFGGYHFVSAHSAHSAAAQAANLRSVSAAKPKPQAAAKAKPRPAVTHKPGKPEAVIRIAAVQDCWVGLKSVTGQSIFQGIVTAGSSKAWYEKQPVSLVVGNPAGITLSVNGRAEKLSPGHVAILSISPASKTPVTGG